MGKLPIKEFLKLDWKKIVIFIIIAIFAFLSIGKERSCYVVDYFDKGYSETICQYSLYPFLWVFSSVEVNIESETSIYFQFLIKTYFIPLIYWYLLSSLIIWAYNKVKKK
jgi:hypothetical protein